MFLNGKYGKNNTTKTDSSVFKLPWKTQFEVWFCMWHMFTCAHYLLLLISYLGRCMFLRLLWSYRTLWWSLLCSPGLDQSSIHLRDKHSREMVVRGAALAFWRERTHLEERLQGGFKTVVCFWVELWFGLELQKLSWLLADWHCGFSIFDDVSPCKEVKSYILKPGTVKSVKTLMLPGFKM